MDQFQRPFFAMKIVELIVSFATNIIAIKNKSLSLLIELQGECFINIDDSFQSYLYPGE